MIQIGTMIQIERATQVGTQTILGTVTMGEVTETGEMTHITVEGQVLVTRIGNMVIEEEQPVTLEMIPVEPTHPHLLTITEL